MRMAEPRRRAIGVSVNDDGFRQFEPACIAGHRFDCTRVLMQSATSTALAVGRTRSASRAPSPVLDCKRWYSRLVATASENCLSQAAAPPSRVMNVRRFTADSSRASNRKDSTPQLRQEPAALRDFSATNDRFGSDSVIRRCLLNVRFGSLFGLKSGISRGPSCAICMARPCGTRWTSKINKRESCINVSGL
jgi:hypothetical protein